MSDTIVNETEQAALAEAQSSETSELPVASKSPLKPTNYVENFASDRHRFYTDKASTVIRTLLITAAGLVCWLSGGTNASSILEHVRQAPYMLLCSLILVVLGLIVDALQYVYASFFFGRWWTYIRDVYDNRSHSEDPETDPILVTAWKKLSRYGFTYKTIEDFTANKPGSRAQKIAYFYQDQEHEKYASLDAEKKINCFFVAKIILTGLAYACVLIGMLV